MSFDFGSKKEFSFGMQFLINSFGKECLKDFESLELLEIVSTYISRIETNAFEYLNKLKKLHLYGNQIEHIEFSIVESFVLKKNTFIPNV